MEKDSKPETFQNYKFPEGAKNFWTLLDDQNRSNGAARGPTSIPTVFSETPQYVLPQLELLGCVEARHPRGALRKNIPRGIFPPGGRHLPNLPY